MCNTGELVKMLHHLGDYFAVSQRPWHPRAVVNQLYLCLKFRS